MMAYEQSAVASYILLFHFPSADISLRFKFKKDRILTYCTVNVYNYNNCKLTMDLIYLFPENILVSILY